jgi:hypothetical protein
LAIGTAKILDRLRNIRTMRVVAGAGLLVYFILVSSPVYSLLTERRIRWDVSFDRIESQEQEGDLIYLAWFISELPLRHYYDGGLPVASAYSYDEALSFEERLVRHSGQRMLTQRVFADLEMATAGVTRVWLVTGRPDFDDTPLQRWFFERGWRLRDVHEINVYSPTILLLESP